MSDTVCTNDDYLNQVIKDIQRDTRHEAMTPRSMPFHNTLRELQDDTAEDETVINTAPIHGYPHADTAVKAINDSGENVKNENVINLDNQAVRETAGTEELKNDLLLIQQTPNDNSAVDNAAPMYTYINNYGQATNAWGENVQNENNVTIQLDSQTTVEPAVDEVYYIIPQAPDQSSVVVQEQNCQVLEAGIVPGSSDEYVGSDANGVAGQITPIPPNISSSSRLGRKQTGRKKKGNTEPCYYERNPNDYSDPADKRRINTARTTKKRRITIDIIMEELKTLKEKDEKKLGEIDNLKEKVEKLQGEVDNLKGK